MNLRLFPGETFDPIPDCVVIRGWLSEPEQADWLKRIRWHAKGWYTPTMLDGTLFSVKVLPFGYRWSLQGYTPEHGRSVPQDWQELAIGAAARAGAGSDSFEAQTALVNYYAPGARLGMHCDRQEDSRLLLAGSPIVTLAIGASAKCKVRHPETNEIKTFTMESGDAWILFGRARNAEHAVDSILPATSPFSDLPGRLSVTFRQVKFERTDAGKAVAA